MANLDECGPVTVWQDYPCKEWENSINSKGYGKVYYMGELIGAHRREYILHYGPIASNIDVMHLCNNKLCYEIKHLKLGTRSDNMIHAGISGVLSRDTIGEKNSQSKLTENDVRSIRKLALEGKSISFLCTIYPVSSQMIGRILRRQAWTHI